MESFVQKAVSPSPEVDERQLQPTQQEYAIRWQSTVSSDSRNNEETPASLMPACAPGSRSIRMSKPGASIPRMGRAQHLSQVGECFRSLFTNDHLTDVIITVQEHTFNAHKAVLITHSDYFKGALIDNKRDGPAEIDLNGIPWQAFQFVLEYMYSFDLELLPENIGDVHTAAQQLKISCLLDLCETKLRSYTAHDALIILKNCSDKSCLIFKRAFQLVVTHFNEVIDAPDLAELNTGTIMTILVSDDLVATTEMDIFLAAIDWIKFDLEKRVSESSRVLGAVRYYYMTPKELLTCTELMEGMKADIHQLLMNAMWYTVAEADKRECHMPMNLPAKRKYISDSPSY